MHRFVVFAGFGGQGLLFAAEALAEAALSVGRETLWIPSYGPEMRGGTASCTVVVADEPIGSPVADRLDMAVVLNPPSLARFEPLVLPGGILVVNASLVEAMAGRTDITEVRPACTMAARAAGHERLTAVVGMGALVAAAEAVAAGLPDAATVRAALRDLVGRKHPELLEANQRAFDAGVLAASSSPDGADAADAGQRADAGERADARQRADAPQAVTSMRSSPV